MAAVAANGEAGPAVAEEIDASEFRAAVERAFELAESDEKIGPAICAAKPRLRFVFTDSDLVLHVWAQDDGRLRWSFDAVEWQPKLTLTMSMQTANRFLQGSESIAVAIARGEVKVLGSAQAALRYLPATRMLREPYRRVIAERHPELAAATA